MSTNISQEIETPHCLSGTQLILSHDEFMHVCSYVNVFGMNAVISTPLFVSSLN